MSSTKEEEEMTAATSRGETPPPTAPTTSPITITKLFHKVISRISWPATTDSTNNNNGSNVSVAAGVDIDTKLRFYGLYKYCMEGPCGNGSSSTTGGTYLWNPTKLAKRRSWQQISNEMEEQEDRDKRGSNKEKAMMEYVTLAANVDPICHQWLQEFYQQQQGEAKKNNDQEIIEEGSCGTVKTNKEVPAISARIVADENNYGIASEKKTTATPPPPPPRTTFWSCLIRYISLLLFPFSGNNNDISSSILSTRGAVMPRGNLDISWYDLLFALQACWKAIIVKVLQWLLPFSFSSLLLLKGKQEQEEEDRIATTIETMWKHQSSKSTSSTMTRTVSSPSNAKEEAAEIKTTRTSKKLDNNGLDDKDSNNNNVVMDIVVGYSVRSLLDLYLMHKQYPPSPSPLEGKTEVLMVPPINIPGMIQIMEHYGLSVVPIDSNLNIISTQSTSIDMKTIQAAITERTVAIMVVHPFGRISASESEFEALRQLADDYSLEIWEDAAECYCGIVTPEKESSFVGSPHADLTLISFGLIKTATALGGGIAIIRERRPTTMTSTTSATPSKDLPAGGGTAAAAVAMRRLQQNLYPTQTVWEYLWNKVIQAIIIKIFSQNPCLYGLFVRMCLAWGGFNFFDRMVTRNVRSIKTTATNGSASTSNWLQSIRRRPCLPLLQLLHRRLKHGNETSLVVKRRIQQCQDMNQIIQKHAPNVTVQCQIDDNIERPVPPTVDDSTMTYWLYPIQVDATKRQHVREYLLREGWDIASGTSQLQCVLPSDEASNCTPPCRAMKFMNQILYLPVASRSLTRPQCIELAVKIRRALTLSSDELASSRQSTSDTRRTGACHSTVSVVVAWLPLFFLLSYVQGGSFMTLLRWFVLAIIPRTVSLLVSALLPIMCLGYGLQWLCGSLYLESSTGFARFNSMIDAAQDNSDPISPKNKNDDCNVDVLDSIDALKVPSRHRQQPEGISCCAILTGGTGFIGSLILRDLLLHRKQLNILGGVYVICRSKRSKSARQRIDALLEKDMYSFLTPKEKLELIHVLEGDVTKRNAGLHDKLVEQLIALPQQERKVVTHVIHSAAAVSFTQELVDAAQANITSALNMQDLTSRLGEALQTNNDPKQPAKPKFVHLSTAFVHGAMSGSKDEPLPQMLFAMDPYDPLELYESMRTSQFYASKAMSDLGFHNTYTFTKCVCEHLLVRQGSKKRVPTQIIRPSIVGPAVNSPYEGWAGQKPSTLVAAGCLYLTYQWNLWCFGPYTVPCIPVDVLSRFILAKAFGKNCASTLTPNSISSDNGAVNSVSSSDDSFERVSRSSSLQSLAERSVDSSLAAGENLISTAAWNDRSSPRAMFTWLDYSASINQLGAIMGYYSRLTACSLFWAVSNVTPRLIPSLDIYESVHHILCRWPMQTSLWICGLMGWTESEQRVSKLLTFLDLPLLFFPYMNVTFHFQSDLRAPETMSGDRYAFSCSVAANRFVSDIKCSRKTEVDKTKEVKTPLLSSFVVAGKNHHERLSLWWALTQPKGSLIVRVTGWLFSMILKSCCHSLTIDLTSFERMFGAKLKAKDNEKSCKVHIVLAPTHRSFFDFIILSYIAFALPELHLDFPTIAAAEDFESLPIIGWGARCLGAFYLRRGRGVPDPELARRVASMKQRGEVVFEVFIEGSRSRDRRFLKPKTGFLRSLGNSGDHHLIVPISINYEKVPEQDILSVEAAGSTERTGLSLGGLFGWLMDVANGKIFLGNIHVGAGKPSFLQSESSSDFVDFAKHIQLEQQKKVHLTEYHVRASACVLNLDVMTVRSAMTQLGCQIWPSTVVGSSTTVELPLDPSELCTVFLQSCVALARVCRKAKPRWAIWFDQYIIDDTEIDENTYANPMVRRFFDSLMELLEAADNQVEIARKRLTRNGFYRPNHRHILETARKENANRRVPDILLNAAVSLLEAEQGDEDSSCQSEGGENVDLDLLLASDSFSQVLKGSQERLGFWGFHDSGFILQANKKGSRYVTMRGKRYSLCGKAMSKLLPFVGTETNVVLNPFKEAFPTNFLSTDGKSSSCICGEALKQLQSNVSEVSFSVSERIRHGTGHAQEDIYSIRRDFACELRVPDAVVWPTTEVQVKGLISIAEKHNLCLIPYGGGTNVTQSTRCPPKDIEPRPILSVDMSRMNRMLWLNEEDGLACLEAGINGRDLVSVLEQRGYTMGHEPDSIEFSTLGGWIATKASGMKRNRYGNIENIVRDVQVATSQGILWQKGNDHRSEKEPVFGRESCGLDFFPMILGSEGCLGIITSAVVRVWPIPEAKEYDSVLLATFECGLRFVRDIAKMGKIIPASVRLLDNEHFRLGQAMQADATSTMERIAKAIQRTSLRTTMSSLHSQSVVCATICYEGAKTEVFQQRAAIRQLCKQHGGVLLGPSVGKAGYDMTFMIAYLRDFAMTYHFLGESFETFVPWSSIQLVINQTKGRIRTEHDRRCLPGTPFIGCRVTQLYHEGACLYFYFCMNTEGVPNASKVFAEIEHAAREEILHHGGSLSHHHGVGKVRSDFLKQSTNPEFQKIVSAVKDTMDPENIFAARNGIFSAS